MSISDNLAAMAAKIESDIETRGISVIGVFPDVVNKKPGFSYTIGLAQMGFPEQIMFGLRPEIATMFFNTFVEDIKMGNLTEQKPTWIDEPNRHYANLPLHWVEVPYQEAREYATFAIERAGTHSQEFSLMQWVWCDARSHFPWDEGFDRKCRAAQPLLGEKPIYRC